MPSTRCARLFMTFFQLQWVEKKKVNFAFVRNIFFKNKSFKVLFFNVLKLFFFEKKRMVAGIKIVILNSIFSKCFQTFAIAKFI
jgi:hypothetical protein